MKMYRLGAIAAIGLLAACGGGDDAEPAAGDTAGVVEPAEEPADEPAENDGNDDANAASDASDADDASDAGDASDADDASDAGDASDADDANDADAGGNASSINSLDDIPKECRDLMGDFLREIEPLVDGIDWENATLAELGELGDSIDAPVSEIDDEMDAAGCNDLEFDGDDEASFELVIELARDEAPGVVGWLEFIQDASTAFDEAAGDGSDGGTAEPADAPEDCDAALQAVRDLMDETDSMTELPVNELLAASTTIQNITTVCSVDEMASLFNDPDFQAWTEG